MSVTIAAESTKMHIYMYKKDQYKVKLFSLYTLLCVVKKFLHKVFETFGVQAGQLFVELTSFAQDIYEYERYTTYIDKASPKRFDSCQWSTNRRIHAEER